MLHNVTQSLLIHKALYIKTTLHLVHLSHTISSINKETHGHVNEEKHEIHGCDVTDKE